MHEEFYRDERRHDAADAPTLKREREDERRAEEHGYAIQRLEE
jgi:hypothetical protein